MQYGHGRDLEILLVSSNSPVQHFQSEISFYKPYHYDMPLRVHSSEVRYLSSTPAKSC